MLHECSLLFPTPDNQSGAHSDIFQLVTLYPIKNRRTHTHHSELPIHLATCFWINTYVWWSSKNDATFPPLCRFYVMFPAAPVLISGILISPGAGSTKGHFPPSAQQDLRFHDTADRNIISTIMLWQVQVGWPEHTCTTLPVISVRMWFWVIGDLNNLHISCKAE